MKSVWDHSYVEYLIDDLFNYRLNSLYLCDATYVMLKSNKTLDSGVFWHDL